MLNVCLCTGYAAHAQQPTATAPPAATSPVKEDAPKGPTPDLLKKAREAGYKTQVHNGVTQFCTETTEIGSHFKTKSCINQGQLELALERRQAQLDQLTNHTCTGCSGK
jgi:hypothetical protein